MKTICKQCNSNIDISYIHLGFDIECPNCNKKIKPEIVEGTIYPDTGYQITYEDFIQLLTYDAYRKEVVPIISEWFKCEVNFSNNKLKIRKKDGEYLVPLYVHMLIQSDSKKQFKLYQVAMSLWR